MKKDYKFNQYYKSLNVFSIALILLSLIFLIFKGLNYGVDFKGGTRIEIRVESEKPNIEVLLMEQEIEKYKAELIKINQRIKEFL